jgi:hypothetical protein
MATNFIIREGFFHADTNGDKVFPRARSRDTKWLGRSQFLTDLAKIQESKKVEVVTIKGQSKCRVCDEKIGTKAYQYKIGAIIFQWPEGLAHYVEEHNVRPGLAFQDFVTQVAALIKG